MEKAILIGIRLPGTKRTDIERSMAELSRLAETAARPAATHLGYATRPAGPEGVLLPTRFWLASCRWLC